MASDARNKGFMTNVAGSTTWLYPKRDLAKALEITTRPYTYDGTNIVCPSISELIGLYAEVFTQTTISQPTGNIGFSCNNGTLLEDMGEDLQWKLTTGEIIVKWRLVRQITPQVNPPLVTPGNSPVGTIGFVTVYCSYGQRANVLSGDVLDMPCVIRIG